jgi:hypothetical protein
LLSQLSPKRDATGFVSLRRFLPGIAQQNLNAFWNASEAVDITKIFHRAALSCRNKPFGPDYS